MGCGGDIEDWAVAYVSLCGLVLIENGKTVIDLDVLRGVFMRILLCSINYVRFLMISADY